MHVRPATVPGTSHARTGRGTTSVVVRRRARRGVPFDDARLKIEYNSTNGDAGLQLLCRRRGFEARDGHEAGGSQGSRSRGRQGDPNLRFDRLFSESSDPPFDEFPFEDFKKLFPEGVYTFRGQDVDRARLKSTFTLAHAIPDAATITSPTTV